MIAVVERDELARHDYGVEAGRNLQDLTKHLNFK
jgi:hypothetical protein